MFGCVWKSRAALAAFTFEYVFVMKSALRHRPCDLARAREAKHKTQG
jgi:hypothetical protein